MSSWTSRLKGALKRDPGAAPAPDAAPAAAPAAAAPAPAKGGGDVTAELKQCLVRESDGKLRMDEIETGVHLFDFGYLDSLSAVAFLGFIEEQYGIAVSEVDLVGRLCTLDALSLHIKELSPS